MLEKIHSVQDVRALSYDQLDVLTEEIREFIVESVAQTGGHLGSNLGAVELTLALHRVFDSPHDAILWDTGHLAYVHKMITGRRDAFDGLRQKDGLSGYPSRAESEHDWIENCHASTVLSYAHGLSQAFSKTSPSRHVVAVIGDGAMTGGMAYEALNNLGHSESRVLIILNDNGRSYAPTISLLSSAVSNVRLNRSWMRMRERLIDVVRGAPGVGELAYTSLRSVKAAVREFTAPLAFFEALGVRYVGPIDGHDIRALETALEQSAEYNGPMVLHVLTEKGRGYKPAEQDDEKRLHDVSKFDLKLGPKGSKPTTETYTDVFSRVILDLGKRNSDLVTITAAMPGPTGLLPFIEAFPDRCIDVGIAEQHAVTMAAGLAMGGVLPVIALYSTFLSRAFDQTNLDVGLHHLPVIFALDRSGITGDDGPSHHGILDMALLQHVPGMTILAPSSAQELEVLLREAVVRRSGPIAIRYPKGAARQVSLDAIGSGFSARRIREGNDVCVLAVGKFVENAESAVESLRSQNIDATLWDVRVVKPLDPAMIDDASRHRLVITIEDGIVEGGVGSAIAGALHKLDATLPVVNLGVPDRYIPQAKPDQIYEELGLTANAVAERIVEEWSHIISPLHTELS